MASPDDSVIILEEITTNWCPSLTGNGRHVKTSLSVDVSLSSKLNNTVNIEEEDDEPNIENIEVTKLSPCANGMPMLILGRKRARKSDSIPVIELFSDDENFDQTNDKVDKTANILEIDKKREKHVSFDIQPEEMEEMYSKFLPTEHYMKMNIEAKQKKKRRKRKRTVSVENQNNLPSNEEVHSTLTSNSSSTVSAAVTMKSSSTGSAAVTMKSSSTVSAAVTMKSSSTVSSLVSSNSDLTKQSSVTSNSGLTKQFSVTSNSDLTKQSSVTSNSGLTKHFSVKSNSRWSSVAWNSGSTVSSSVAPNSVSTVCSMITPNSDSTVCSMITPNSDSTVNSSVVPNAETVSAGTSRISSTSTSHSERTHHNTSTVTSSSEVSHRVSVASSKSNDSAEVSSNVSSAAVDSAKIPTQSNVEIVELDNEVLCLTPPDPPSTQPPPTMPLVPSPPGALAFDPINMFPPQQYQGNQFQPFIQNFPITFNNYTANISNHQVNQYQYQFQCIDTPQPIGHLRPIAIDGSNVAFSHGKEKYFSCRGIEICIEYFLKRGHQTVKAFVPQHRRSTSNKQNVGTEILERLAEGTQYVVFTPTRRVKRRLICPYDDRFILEYAGQTGAVVVSNDNYRDLLNESQDFRTTIEERLLMYTFADDVFMVPQDPMGKHGPTLHQFLTF